MKGFPKTVNNKYDIENLLLGYPVETKAYLQRILDNKDQWLMVSKLEDTDAGITDATHKIEELTDEADVVTERYQYELKEDPDGELYRMGYSGAGEVEALLMEVL